MPKKALSLALWFILLSFPVFAEESITITTYYPSPYGSNDQFQANKIAVGDTNGNGQTDSADLTVINPGEAGFALGLYLKPQAGDPTNWALAPAGRQRFSAMKGAPYYSNGSTWVEQGGGTRVLCYEQRNTTGYTPYCLTGFTNMGKIGNWGYCIYQNPSPPPPFLFAVPFDPTLGPNQCPGLIPVISGDAYLCCDCPDCPA